MTYGVGFASLAALVAHVALFHGRDIWEQSKSSFQEKTMDIHTKLMRKYKQVPELWFVIILIATIGLSLFACEYYKDQLQLPWWGVLLACGIAFFFTLPIGIIAAIKNQTPGLNIITEYVIGYMYPGYPVANVLFKTYKPDWWRHHNYVLSGALDAGLAFMAMLIYFCLGMGEVSHNLWGNNLDGCPFASCPTAKGVVAGDGCPVF
nr:oligopeptide transporter 7 [Quercus suber]POE76292.1 oligopeptide transporter 7 [Quercus suber]